MSFRSEKFSQEPALRSTDVGAPASLIRNDETFEGFSHGSVVMALTRCFT